MYFSHATYKEKKHKCIDCDKEPAVAAYDDGQNYPDVGPYCRLHWIEYFINKFDRLEKE